MSNPAGKRKHLPLKSNPVVGSLIVVILMSLAKQLHSKIAKRRMGYIVDSAENDPDGNARIWSEFGSSKGNSIPLSWLGSFFVLLECISGEFEDHGWEFKEESTQVSCSLLRLSVGYCPVWAINNKTLGRGLEL